MKTHSIDQIFKAFADPSRLRLLNLLRRGERCVCDLMAVLKLPQSKVSRHLSYLKRAGLVESHRDGLWIHYELARPQTKFHQQILSCLDGCLQEAPILKIDLEKLKKTPIQSRCC